MWLNPRPYLSVSLWFYPTSFAPAYQTLTFCAGGSYHEIMVKSTGKMAWYISSLSTLDPGSGTASLNAWNHAAFTFVGGTASVGCRTFLNGVSDGNVGSNTESPTTAPFLIGSEAAARRFNGFISHVAIWSATLSSGEIAALYRGALPNTIRPGSIVGYWPLDGYDAVAADLGPYKLYGVPFGSVNLAANPPLINNYRSPRIGFPTREIAWTSPAPSFKSGWARQSNLPVIGGGTF